MQCLKIEYQSITIGGNISLARGKRLKDECATAAVDRQLIRTKILVINYPPPNFRIHPMYAEGYNDKRQLCGIFDWCLCC